MQPLELLKYRLGITTRRRDTYLQQVLTSCESELTKNYGVTLDIENQSDHLMFLVDFAQWRYMNASGAMPRDLQFRLHNLLIEYQRGDNRVER